MAIEGIVDAGTSNADMQAHLGIRGYRSFGSSLASLEIRRGITALIGPNNAGKSNILRALYDARPWFSAAQQALRTFASDGLLGVGLNEETLPGFHCNSVDEPAEVRVSIREVGRGSCDAVITFPRNGHPPKRALMIDGSELSISRVEEATGIVRVDGIPDSRLSALHETLRCWSDTQFLPAFRNAINAGASRHFDTHIGTGFVNSWRSIRTGANRTKQEAALRVVEDIRRLAGYRTLEIDADQSANDLILRIDGRHYMLGEVGGGMAQLILALATAGIRRPQLILIDEPELNLHPSLQADFLTTLASYAKHGVLCATHSLGLARTVADRLWSVSRTADDGFSRVAPFERDGNLSELLGAMMYAGRSDLGFDRVLLVEGVHEVKTFQQWLRLFGKDHRVAVLPLGGTALICGGRELELGEFARIAKGVTAIIDSERASEVAPLTSSREAFACCCKAAGIACHVLERRATENYLSERAVRATLGASASGLGPFDARTGTGQGWAKADNWRIAREMSLGEIESTDLGRVLSAL